MLNPRLLTTLLLASRAWAQTSSETMELFEVKTVGGMRPKISVISRAPVHSWRLLVDGADFTSVSTTGPKRLGWCPSFDLRPGEHTVAISATDQWGKDVRRSWTFLVEGQRSDTCK
jgi:hypothetical protein